MRPGKGLTTRGQDVKGLTNRPQGRVALGEISQNVTARRQPLRAAKQVKGLKWKPYRYVVNPKGSTSFLDAKASLDWG